MQRRMTRRAFVASSSMAMLLAACSPSPQDAPPEELALPDNADTSVFFSHEAGAYAQSTIDLEVSNPSGLPVVYTTDGSVPTASSRRCDGAITLTPADTNSAFIRQLADEIPGKSTILVDASLPTATVIRAAALLPSGEIGPVSTSTYFVGEDIVELFGNIMVVSLVVDPFDLLDYETGIMAKGAIYDEHIVENAQLSTENQYLVQANYSQKGKAWERAASLELFDRSNTLTATAPCGIRLRGYMSRVFAQKSFNLYFRKKYGADSLECALFGDGGAASYDDVYLRAGGNAAERASFRDPLLQDLLSGYAFSTQKTRPAIVFLNGEFYGVFSLGEKYSEDYVEHYYGVSKNNVVIFEDGELDEGVEDDAALYEELAGFAERDLSDDTSWDAFCSAVDVQSMVDCYAAEIYISNPDFHDTKNCRVWRARKPEDGTEHGDTRWRWMIYDLEYSAGLYGIVDATKADFDTFDFYLDNSPLFASAMRSPVFRAMLRERLVDLMTGVFRPENVVDAFDGAWVVWKPWIDMTCKRFSIPLSKAADDLAVIREFFIRRPLYILPYFDRHAAEFDKGRE